MQLEIQADRSLYVATLSESNLLALISQLAGFYDQEWDMPGIRRLVEADWWLRVHARPDDVHPNGPDGLDAEIDHQHRDLLVMFSATNLSTMLGGLRTCEDGISPPLIRQFADAWTLCARGETDARHYARRRRGRMNPITEQAMERFRKQGVD